MVCVWGDATPRWNDFITNPYGHGWHIDRALFDRMLADECRARGASLVEGVKAGHCTHGNGGWRVSLHAGRRQAEEHVSCRFLVDATGRGLYANDDSVDSLVLTAPAVYAVLTVFQPA